MVFKILDLFAGVGGLSLGFEFVKEANGKNEFELFRAVEMDEYACQTLKKRYGEDKVIQGDITNLKTAKKIIDDCKNEVSIVVGGIPCQSFSLLGPRSGYGKKIEKYREDKRDNLYEHFRDIVEEIKPKIIVIENVKGILSKKDSHGTKIIDKLISDFEYLGYNFINNDGQKWHVLNAADFGVPQKRERVILIGINKKWNKSNIPLILPTHYNPNTEDAAAMKAAGRKPYVTLSEAIGDLPKVEPLITLTDIPASEKNKILSINKKRNPGCDFMEEDISLLKKHLNKISVSGKDFFNFIRQDNNKTIYHHTARSQQMSDIRLFRLMKQGETAEEFVKRNPVRSKKLIKYDMHSFKDKYRKQKAAEPSTTIFAHLEKDGNRFIHPTEARTLTPREAARLQSFPDDFIFEGPISKKFKQIGNAVPPLLAYNIAKTIHSGLLK